MSSDQKATYGHIVVYYCLQKEDPYRTRLALGVNLINYPSNFGTPMAGMLPYKFLFNIVLSITYAKFIVIDIKKFYLKMPMSWYEYTILPINITPQAIIHEYQLMNKLKTASSCVKYD